MVQCLVVLSFFLIAAAQDQTCAAGDESCQAPCQDNHQASNECSYWASIGECFKNPNFMDVECRQSCELCPGQQQTGADLGVPQKLQDEVYKVSKFLGEGRLKIAREYLKTADLSDEMKTLCRNKQELCTVWAVAGECENNPEFMKKECAPACKSCLYNTIEGRCPIDPNAPRAWKPGDLNAMFERLVGSQEDTGSAQILSSPATPTGDPWILQLDNVITEEEASRLIELGKWRNN